MKNLRWGWTAALALALTACGTVPQPAAAPESAPQESAQRTLLQYGGGLRGRELRPVDTYASSTYKGAFAYNATNRDTDSQWASGGYQERDAWLVLRYPGQPYFDYAEIKTGPLNRGAYYRFEVSDDGYRWRPVSPRLSNSSWQLEAKQIGASGRFLRVHFFNSRYNPMARFAIYEINVYGQGAGGYGYGGYGGYDGYGGYGDGYPHRRY